MVTLHRVTSAPMALDGGVEPIIRFDVIQADYYKALISHPISFSQSPTLADTVTWTGSTTVSDTSDTLMSDYDTNKITYDNTTEYDLTVAGSTWFKVSSEIDYGYKHCIPRRDVIERLLKQNVSLSNIIF